MFQIQTFWRQKSAPIPKFSGTGSETFFRYQIFPIPVPIPQKKMKNSRYREFPVPIRHTLNHRGNLFLGHQGSRLNFTLYERYGDNSVHDLSKTLKRSPQTCTSTVGFHAPSSCDSLWC